MIDPLSRDSTMRHSQASKDGFMQDAVDLTSALHFKQGGLWCGVNEYYEMVVHV